MGATGPAGCRFRFKVSPKASIVSRHSAARDPARPFNNVYANAAPSNPGMQRTRYARR